MAPDTKIFVDRIRELSGRQLLGDKRANPEGRVPSNVWSIPRVTGNSWEREEWHPTQHPVKLMERICLISLAEGDWIIDLFAGSGSMFKAMNGLGKMNCLGVEIDQFYCQKIIEKNKTVQLVELEKILINGLIYED